MKRLRFALINIFIIMNLMMMIRAQIKTDHPLIKTIYLPVTHLQNYFSIWRGWRMFAPNPLRSNIYVDAKVHFTDNSIVIYNFTNIENETLFKKYLFSERYRKYMTDALRLNRYNFLWEDAAIYIQKRIDKKYPQKKVSQITLRRRWQDIPNWNQEFIHHKKQMNKKTFKSFEYYTYKVKN